MADETSRQSIDPATLEMISKAKTEGISTAFERAEKMKPCPIGQEGSCCRVCSMGPCRVPMRLKTKRKPPKRKPAARASAGLPPRPSPRVISRV